MAGFGFISARGGVTSSGEFSYFQRSQGHPGLPMTPLTRLTSAQGPRSEEVAQSSCWGSEVAGTEGSHTC